MAEFKLVGYIDSLWSRQVSITVEAEDLGEAQQTAREAFEMLIDTNMELHGDDEAVKAIAWSAPEETEFNSAPEKEDIIPTEEEN